MTRIFEKSGLQKKTIRNIFLALQDFLVESDESNRSTNFIRFQESKNALLGTDAFTMAGTRS